MQRSVQLRRQLVSSKLLLAFASTAILGSGPCRTHDHIFLSQNSELSASGAWKPCLYGCTASFQPEKFNQHNFRADALCQGSATF
jgi:hypothetical protein